MSRFKSIISIMILSVLLFSCSNNTANKNDGTNQEQPEEKTEEKANPNQLVNIKDAQLEKLIREDIQKPEGDLTVLDMEMVTGLNINFEETPVYEFDGLEHAINMYYFSYRNGVGKSLQPISKLPNLEKLTISYSTIEEESETFTTPLLESVSFIDTNIFDFSFLSNATAITNALIDNSNVVDITFLKDWNNLEILSMDENQIVDITPLKDKKNLTDLSFHMNQIVNIEVIATLDNLQFLNLSYNNIVNIDPVLELNNLQAFTIYEKHDSRLIDYGLIDVLLSKGVNVEYHG